MGIPIRWDNIHGPDFRTASGILGQSQASMNTAISGIGNIFQGMNNLEQENWNTGKTNNTNAFMRQLMGYKTPEEYQAAMQAGALNDQLTGYGAQVDSDAAMKAMDRRLVTLQQRDLADMQYQGSKLEKQQAPIRDRIATKIALGQIPAAMAELEANPGLLNTAPLAQAADARTWLGKERGQQETVWAATNKEAPARLQLLEGQGKLAESQATLALSKAYAESTGEGKGGSGGKGKADTTIELTKEQLTEQARNELLAKDSSATNGSASGIANIDQITEFINANVSKDAREEVMSHVFPYLSKEYALKDGKKMNVPLDVLKSAIVSSSPTFWQTNKVFNPLTWSPFTSRASRLDDAISSMMNSDRVKADVNTRNLLDKDKLTNPLDLVIRARKLKGKIVDGGAKKKDEDLEEEED